MSKYFYGVEREFSVDFLVVFFFLTFICLKLECSALCCLFFVALLKFGDFCYLIFVSVIEYSSFVLKYNWLNECDKVVFIPMDLISSSWHFGLVVFLFG